MKATTASLIIAILISSEAMAEKPADPLYYNRTVDGERFEITYGTRGNNVAIAGNPQTITLDGYPQLLGYAMDEQKVFPKHLSLTLPRKKCMGIYYDSNATHAAIFFSYKKGQYIALIVWYDNDEHSDCDKFPEGFSFLNDTDHYNLSRLYENDSSGYEDPKEWEYGKWRVWRESKNPDIYQRQKSGRVNFSYYKDTCVILALNILPMYVPVFRAYIENSFQVKSDFDNERIWHERLKYERGVREGRIHP